MMPTDSKAPPKFKCFRQFNQIPVDGLASSSALINSQIAEQYFNSDSLQDKLVRELSNQQALSVKEILESFEFFERVRKHVRAPSLTDLCCGHGLTGILFALFERSVECVTLVDRQEPRSFEKIFHSAVRVGPWVADKVHHEVSTMKNVLKHIEPSTSIIAIHACGSLTDRCIDCALAIKAPVAVMPCCYSSEHGCRAPETIRLAFGPELARDIHRTYRLDHAGYLVKWDYIPKEITPKNRIILGTIGSDS